MTTKRYGTTHVRIKKDVLKEIREAMPSNDFPSDTERLTTLWKVSPFRFDKWLGTPLIPRKKNK